MFKLLIHFSPTSIQKPTKLPAAALQQKGFGTWQALGRQALSYALDGDYPIKSSKRLLGSILISSAQHLKTKKPRGGDFVQSHTARTQPAHLTPGLLILPQAGWEKPGKLRAEDVTT